MTRNFSTTYYAIVVVGGGVFIASYNMLTSSGDTYSGLVLGLVLILVGCLIPLFASTESPLEQSATMTASEEQRNERTVALNSAESVEGKDPLADGWDLPL